MPLAGAGFSITGQGLATVTPTGPDGTACVDGLLYGTYTVTETGPPPGYELGAPSTKTLTVTSDGDCQGRWYASDADVRQSARDVPDACCIGDAGAHGGAARDAHRDLHLHATGDGNGSADGNLHPAIRGGAPATATPIPPSGGAGVPGQRQRRSHRPVGMAAALDLTRRPH